MSSDEALQKGVVGGRKLYLGSVGIAECADAGTVRESCAG